MARQLGRSERTVRRLLSDLRAAGVVVVASRADDGTQRKLHLIQPPAALASVRLDALDAIALRLLLARARPRPGMPFADEVEVLEDKLRDALEPRWTGLYDDLSRVVVESPQPPPPEPADPVHAEALLDAARLRQLCDVVYTAADGRERAYPIGPLALRATDDGRLYLAAWVPKRNATRLFALSRFRDVRRLRDHFTPPPDFDPADWFARPFGIFHDGDPTARLRVRVRFDPRVARTVKERSWHPSQTFTDLPDGAVDVTIEAEGRSEIIAWVLRYGELAELLDPPELRQELATRLRATLARYEPRSEHGKGERADE